MKQEKRNLYLNILYPILLVLYGMMLINQGVTATDTGYNYGNFMQFSSLDGMWKFSTYLATALGALFTKLPFGHTMLGLNFYTGLIKIAIALLGYFFFVKEVGIKKELAFLGELMALGYCWCPTALIYNYLTYLLFTLGAMLLCMAEKRGNFKLFLCAGAVLGTNVFVRLPNLAEVALIFALWISCFLEKRGIKETAKRTAWCVLGYMAVVLVLTGILFAIYGPANVYGGIKDLLDMSQSAKGYSVTAMIRGDIEFYLRNLRWILCALAVTVFGTVLYAWKKEKWLLGKRILFGIAAVCLLAFYYKMDVFRFTYYNYWAIEAVGVIFLLLAGIMGLYVLFFSKEQQLRMMAAVMGIIILVTPLGSNNYLYSAENNLFFAAPLTLYFLYLLWNSKVKEWKAFSLEPLKIMVSVLVLFTFVQGVAFGMTFAFRDGIEGEKRTEEIANNDVLAGMKTCKENAEPMQALNDYLVQENLKGSEVILYGDVPALAFYMDLVPAVSTTWPDLDSFSVRKFSTDILNVMEADKRPIVILGKDPEEIFGLKVVLLGLFMEEYGYEETFTTGEWHLYR